MSDEDMKAWEVLRDHQGQADIDGTFVTVYRQAVDETVEYVQQLEARIAELESREVTDEPVAWAVYAPSGDIVGLHTFKSIAEENRRELGPDYTVVPIVKLQEGE